MTSKPALKCHWTWEEWQASRAERRAVAERFGPPVVRRRHSSADPRLGAAFGGERGPAFYAARPAADGDSK